MSRNSVVFRINPFKLTETWNDLAKELLSAQRDKKEIHLVPEGERANCKLLELLISRQIALFNQGKQAGETLNARSLNFIADKNLHHLGLK